jgi:hypothetical protein
MSAIAGTPNLTQDSALGDASNRQNHIGKTRLGPAAPAPNIPPEQRSLLALLSPSLIKLGGTFEETRVIVVSASARCRSQSSRWRGR